MKLSQEERLSISKIFGARSSLVERFSDKEEVDSSILSVPTTKIFAILSELEVRDRWFDPKRAHPIFFNLAW